MKRQDSSSGSDTPREMSLARGPHEFIEERAARNPDAIAVEMGHDRLSYRELNETANRLAHLLRERGVGPGHAVGVLLDRSIQMVVSLLAILKAGGVYLPLDPKFPRERLAFMLADAEARFLLTHAALKEAVPPSGVRIVDFEEFEGSLSGYPATNLAPVNKPLDLGYIIYTSGSTGRPKGVMISRRSLVNFLLSMQERPGIEAQDVVLAVTTISFDISILELLLPLSIGARIVVAGRAQTSDAHALKELLQEYRVTMMQATPTTWRMLVESSWPGKTDLKILCGGEALTGDLAEHLLPRCKELWNMYGPTETTIWSSTTRITSAQEISLGRPIANTYFYVVDENLKQVPAGTAGELLIGGDGLAAGYFNRAGLTAEKFIPDTFGDKPSARLYRTGDEVRYRSDGSLAFLGRLDHQVKLNGFRIELGEVENAIAKINGVAQAAVVVREDVPGEKRLVAYYMGPSELGSSDLKQALKAFLPEYMLPAAFVWMKEFPRTPNAKLDRKSLPPPPTSRPTLAQQFVAPRTDLERRLAALWCEQLQLDQIGIDDSFFDLGGTSLTAVRMTTAYHARFGQEIPLIKVFQYPTIAQLCRLLESKETDSTLVAAAERRAEQIRKGQSRDSGFHDDVAIIGMVGRFPGADNLDQLWRNLCEERESISFFETEELGPGIDERLRNDADYIRARGIIEGAELFDAAFFGISPLEAKVMDPQQRLFLELAYHALENAGYDPDRYRGLIGVYAGIGDNHYYTTNLLTQPGLLAMAGKLAVEYGNQKDYIALRAAYLLDLRGPAVSLNTACSTTLLAADQAYRALLDYECDLALAGGIDITVPQKSGFLYTEGGTFAKDGHCRPFDADASGTMFCDGAGLVVLKRLSEAIADGDTIYAVLKGSGKNNNGARPASFLAPSVEGQAEAIAIAQSRAGIDIETIGYIEAHGTGTPVGDPIEISALNSVFEKKTQKKQFCYIGSIKGNIGHPTNAAGVAGLIKAAMVLDREQIPATLHFRKPNPRIDFENSPFVVANKLVPFPRSESPRHTAVSSFGFGGTNVHMILEEAPLPRTGAVSRRQQLLVVSARTLEALEASGDSLASHLEIAHAEDFADAAFTLQTGRKQMAHRRFVVAGDPREAAALLHKPSPVRCASKQCERRDPPVVFLFGGQGTQYVNMGLNLYQGEPLFRAVVDNCCDILKPHLGRDLRELLYPQSGDDENARVSLQDTFYTQPSIFVIEYALARFWQSIGINPAVMAGHSIGEFVAATLADVWDLEDALRIVALRGSLMQNQPRGMMMAVKCSADEVSGILPPSLNIASNNAPSLCVVSGPEQEVVAFRSRCEADRIVCQPLHTSHAFHSAMMDPIVEPLRREVEKIALRAPSLPIVSTVTGRLITDEETTNPTYWARHARATVEFSKAILSLKEMGHDLFLECGARSTLCSLTRQHFGSGHPCVTIPSLADTHENDREWTSMLFALGSLWLNGVTVDWDAFYVHEQRHRIPLPTYPFERKRYWVDPAPPATFPAEVRVNLAEKTANPVELVNAPEAPAKSADAQSGEGRKARVMATLVEILAPISGCGTEDISTSATFLELGFDSLSLAQVALAIQREFGVKLGFSKLMDQLPNIETVAAYLEETIPANKLAAFAPAPAAESAAQSKAEQKVEAVASDLAFRRLAEKVEEQGQALARMSETIAELRRAEKPALPETDKETNATSSGGMVVVPSTVPQRGIFFSSRLSDHLSAAYNESMTVRIRGAVSIPKLSRSLQRLVNRHDALRASFDESGSVMSIRPELQFSAPIMDLSGDTSALDSKQELTRIESEETARPFTLPGGPLFRSQIVVMSEEECAVIMTGHHIICDGWSLDVLVHDFCTFYSEEISGTAAGSLGIAPSFARYANDVVMKQKSAEFTTAREFWEKKFASGFPALMLPTDYPRVGQREHRAKRADRVLHPSLIEKLRKLGTKQGCSFFTVTVSALAILLARVSRQRRFVLALPTAEQPTIGQTELVGHCVSLLPFLVELESRESVNAYLSRVQRELGMAHEHSSFTMVSLLEHLVSADSTRNVPAISAGLTSVKQFRQQELEQRGFEVEYYANPKCYESFEWYLNTIESEQGLQLHCHYNTELLKEATVEEWLAAFESILESMAANPETETLELARLDPVQSVLTAKVQFVYSSKSSRNLQAARKSDNVAPNPLSAAGLQADFGKQDETVLNRLLIIWKDVLGCNTIKLDDNFFDLGGNSMMAAELFALIERELGINAPLASLYEAPTPRELVGLLTGEANEKRWRSLVPIQPEGDRPPLFLIHGAEGNVLLYRTLASHMGQGQPVYGLQSEGLDGKSQVDGDFKRVAERYIEEIRQVQHEGPYMLGGYCLGGVLALEVAQQLRRAGQSVGLLAMLEVYNVRSIRWPLPWHVRAINRMLINPYNHLLNLLAAEGSGKVEFFREKFLVEVARAKASARVTVARLQRSWSRDGAEGYHHIRVADVWDRALSDCEIKPYDGEITLFMPKHHLMGMDDPKGGWEGIAKGGLVLHSLACRPKGSLTDPYAGEVARLLRSSIDKAIAQREADRRTVYVTAT